MWFSRFPISVHQCALAASLFQWLGKEATTALDSRDFRLLRSPRVQRAVQ